MKSTVETLSPTRAKLTVEVPFDELKPSLDSAYKKIAQQVNVPGFRRGKVPAAIIDRQVGRGAVLDQAINDALPQLYVAALQENDLQPLAQPEIDITRLEDNDTLEFVAEVDVRPEIEIPSYDGLEATVDTISVTDEEVEEQIQSLRERFGTLVDVERAAADGDFVVIDLTATKDDEVVEGGEAAGVSYQIGRGGMIDGLDEALVGHERRGDQDLRLRASPGATSPVRPSQIEVTVSGRQGAAAARARRRVRPDGVGVRHRPRARGGRAGGPAEEQASRAGRRCPRRSAREDARHDRGAAARDRGRRRAARPPREHRAAAHLRRHDDGAVPRLRGADRRRVRGRPRASGARRGRRPVHPRRGRQDRGARASSSRSSPST